MKSSANALLVVLLFGLILVGGLLLLLPASGGSLASSVLSNDPKGWRALLLLLDELGYDARAFTAAPSELPAEAALVMAEEPPEPLARPPTSEDEETPAGRELRGRRDPRHYRRFLERGGVLVAPADTGVLLFLELDLGLEEVDAIEWHSAGTVASIELPSGEVLDLGGAETRLADAEELPENARVLATGPGGDAFALALPCGAGTLVLLPPGAARWSNAALGSGDRALAFVRLLEAAGAPRTVLFDEYALGAWTPDSPVQLAFGPHAFLLSAHLVVLAALLLWRAVWAGPFPRDPEPLARVSALARARAVARLIELSAPSGTRTS